jgi:hypothetical protein
MEGLFEPPRALKVLNHIRAYKEFKGGTQSGISAYAPKPTPNVCVLKQKGRRPLGRSAGPGGTRTREGSGMQCAALHESGQPGAEERWHGPKVAKKKIPIDAEDGGNDGLLSFLGVGVFRLLGKSSFPLVIFILILAFILILVLYGVFCA